MSRTSPTERHVGGKWYHHGGGTAELIGTHTPHARQKAIWPALFWPSLGSIPPLCALFWNVYSVSFVVSWK
jgi:hypothetical protein